MEWLRRLVDHLAFAEFRFVLWVLVSGVGGALGMLVVPKRSGARAAWLRWILAWALCAAGFFGIAAIFVGMRGAPLLLLVVVGVFSLPVRLARHWWRGAPWPSPRPALRRGWDAFLAETGLQSRRDVYTALLLPVTAQRVLRWAWRRIAGGDGYRPGFALGTAFLGPLSLWLWEPPRRWWLRVPLTVVALPLAALGAYVQVRWGFWVLLLVPVLRVGPFLHACPWRPADPVPDQRPPGIRLEPLDRVALAVVGALFLVLLVAAGRLRPFAPDAYYHLLVARQIVETGAVPLWSWWDYAPLGRPHLYAPLIHLLIALCSLPFGGDVVLGLRVLQVTLLPAALLSVWYAVRWVYDARVALLAMLFLGADFMFALLSYMALPSILANALQPLLLLMVLRRRFVPATAMLAIILYAHPGVGSLTVLSLAVYAAWEKRYRAFLIGVIPLALLLALPWYGHVWAWREWMGHPMRGVVSGPQAWVFKLFWLMNLNLALLVVALRGLRRVNWRDPATRLVASLLIGFIPMLISYGGRYFAHTVPWWAVFAAMAVAPLLARRDRGPILAAVFFFVLVLPTVMLSAFNEGQQGLHYQPMVSAYVVAPAFALGGVGEDNPGNYADPGLLEAAAWIEANTPPETILHVGGDASLGVMLGYHANRRIDTAAWPEVRRPEYTDLLNHYAANDPAGCHVARDPAKIPAGVEPIEVGGLYIAHGPADSTPASK